MAKVYDLSRFMNNHYGTKKEDENRYYSNKAVIIYITKQEGGLERLILVDESGLEKLTGESFTNPEEEKITGIKGLLKGLKNYYHKYMHSGKTIEDYLKETNESVTHRVPYLGGGNGWIVKGAYDPNRDEVFVLDWLSPAETLEVLTHEYNHRWRHFHKLPQDESLVEADTVSQLASNPEYQELKAQENQYRNAA